MKVFSIREAIRYGFSTAWQHITFFAVATLAAIAAGITGIIAFIGINWSTFSFLMTRVPEVCGFMFTTTNPSEVEMQSCVSAVLDFFSQHLFFYSTFLLLGFALLLVISMYCILGWMNALLFIYDHNRSSFTTLFVSWRRLLPFIGASMLYFLMVSLGFMLLVIPGIILSLQFGFYGLVIVDKKVGVMEALRLSSRITAGAKWKLLLMGLCIGIISAGISLVAFLLLKVASFMGAMTFVTRIVDGLVRALLYIVASLAGVYAYRTLDEQTTLPVKASV